MVDTIYLCVSIVTAIIAILSMQLKNMIWVLACQLSASFLVAVTYVILGGISGAVVSLVAVAQSFIMFFYNKKNKMPEKWLTAIFIAAYALCSVFTSHTFSAIMAARESGALTGEFLCGIAAEFATYIDLFPACAAVCFALAIAQKDSRKFRFWGLLNPFLWLPFDFYYKGYINFPMHLGMFISALIAKIRLDIIPDIKAKREREEKA